MARQMITCESCGKRYDYLKSEACPNCGAFNYVKEPMMWSGSLR